MYNNNAHRDLKIIIMIMICAKKENMNSSECFFFKHAQVSNKKCYEIFKNYTMKYNLNHLMHIY